MKSRTSRPALDGDLAQRVGLVPRRDLEHAGGTRLGGQSELLRQGLDTGAGGVDVERDLAAQQVGRDPAEDDVGIGDGHVGATLGVAERTRIGARRLRTDLEGALGREVRDRAAAGTDGDDVDHRDLGGVDTDTALGGQRGFAVDDHADVGGGPTSVAGEDPVEAGDLGDEGRAEGTGSRSGEHRGDRLVDDLVGAQHPAVGLHDVERHRPASTRLEPALDVRDVAAQPRLDRRVDQGRHGTLVLAVLAQHLAADADDRVGVLLGQDRAHPLLVVGVGVGVEEADADRADALVPEPAGRGARALLVEGPHLGAGEVEPALDPAHQVARHDPVRLHPEVGVAIAVRHALPGDLEHRLIAGGGDVAERVDLALEQLVGRDRRAVRHRGHVVVRRPVEQAEHLLDAGEEAVRGVAGGGRRLRRDRLTGGAVEGHHVGEGAAGVDADPDPPVVGARHGDDSTDPAVARATAEFADERLTLRQDVQSGNFPALHGV